MTQQAQVPVAGTNTGVASILDTSGRSTDFVTMHLDGQLFGIPVRTVQDILAPQKIARIPLAPPEVSGSLNLRGRIVTVVNVRRRLALPARPKGDRGMSVVVDYSGELYSLMVDSVGEVLSLPKADLEPNPSTLDAVWREVSVGVYKLDKALLVVLDVSRLLDFTKKIAN